MVALASPSHVLKASDHVTDNGPWRFDPLSRWWSGIHFHVHKTLAGVHVLHTARHGHRAWCCHLGDFLERAALLAALYSKVKSPPLIAMVFSWPSDGKPSYSGYLNDWIDAYVSAPAIARAMDRLARLYLRQAGHRWERNNCGQRIHLVAHSMGAHALKHAITVYGRLPGARMVRFFDTAILAAANTEHDALERSDTMAPLARLAKSVHCYINAADKPLELADEIVDPPDRLGSYGPCDLKLAQEVFGTTPLSIIDCRGADFWGQDLTRHQYYRMSPKVVSDIVEAIEG